MSDERGGEPPNAVESTAALLAGVVGSAIAFVFRGATLLPPGFFDALALAALGLGVSPLAHRLMGPPAATLARGAGFAAAALVATIALVPPFDRAALPLAAWALGGALVQASTRARRNGVVFGALGVALLALGCALAWTVSPTWPETARLRATIVAAAALAAIALLVRLVVARRSPRLAPSPVGLLLGATLATTYVGYRPLVASQVDNLPLYEWTLGVGVAVLLLGRLRRAAHDASVPEAWSGQARRHRQDAAPAYDLRMPPLAAAIQRYLEEGQGFEEYRAAMQRAAPHAPPAFRKALQGARPVTGRGRAGKAARAERLRVHDELVKGLETDRHGEPTPPLRSHP